MALLLAAFASPVPALVDASALVALAGRHAEYGRLRLWGSVGWGVSAVVVGWLVAERGPRAVFVVYVVLMAACALCALRIPVGARVAPGGFSRQATALARDRRLWAFLAMAFLGGTGLGAVNAYVPLQLDDLGARRLVGVALLVGVISEPPFMFAAGRLLRRYGVVQAFVAAYVFYAGRALALALVDVPWLVVALQLGHGPAYAVSWVAGVTLARRLAPEGLSATAQALFTSTSIGLGGFAGNVVGGALFSIDPAATFGFAAIVLGIGVPLVALTAGRGLMRRAPV
jgi:PPP family 3-phenylpropionic acid transporter